MKDYPRQDTSGTDRQFTGGEEVVAMGIGTDAGSLDMIRRNAQSLQLQTAACPKVNVPLVITPRYPVHGIACLGKLVIHFVAHLEMVE